MKPILVTGGGGFLGQAIIRELLARSLAVRSFSRQKYAVLESLGVEQITGDLTNPLDVDHAVNGCEVIFHVAAKAGVWGNYQDYYKPNVIGCQNILLSCQKYQVSKLIYTSTPSVVHSGDSLEGIDESYPYAAHFQTHYPKTKAIAEQMILAANSDSFSTVALRPHLIWGPNDPHLIPRILKQASQGKLRQIGKGDNLVDTIYIDNAALGHLDAMDHLKPGASSAGKAYFLTQGEPVKLWEFINRILLAKGMEPIRRKISYRLAYAMGGLLEMIYRTIPLLGEPPITRFVATQLASSHWYRIDRAKKEIGYKVRLSTEEGLQKLQAWFKEAT